MRRTLIALSALLIVALLLSGCGSDSASKLNGGKRTEITGKEKVAQDGDPSTVYTVDVHTCPSGMRPDASDNDITFKCSDATIQVTKDVYASADQGDLFDVRRRVAPKHFNDRFPQQ